jgi:hypothetical protein
MYERAANPNGAAVVMNMEHCKKRRRRVERGTFIFGGWAVPFAADLLLLAVGADIRGSVSSPKIRENAWPG